MSRIVIALLASAGLLFTVATTTSAQDLDCVDFGSQEEAQQYLNADPSDPSQLDADDDGWACEVFFGYTGTMPPGQTQDPVPDDDIEIDQLPNTGSGMPMNGPPFAPLALWFLAAVAAGGGLTAKVRAVR